MAHGIFDDVLFPVDISFGAVGGPVFSTKISETGAGFEQRGAERSRAPIAFEVFHGAKNEAQKDTLKNFFFARFGGGNSFRYKDWTDYKITGPQLIGTGDGVQKDFQVTKIYDDGVGVPQTRIITKLVSGTVNVYLDDVLQVSGFTIDLITGIISFSVAPGGGVTVKVDCDFEAHVKFLNDKMNIVAAHLDKNFSWTNISIGEVPHDETVQSQLPSTEPDPAANVFDFREGVLPANTTLTRASAGTYINSDGDHVDAVTDEARFTYDSMTEIIEGMLNEPARTNYYDLSNDFDHSNAPDGAFPYRATVVADVIQDPSGAVEGSSVTETTASSNDHGTQPYYENSIFGQGLVVDVGFSIWMKPGKKMTDGDRGFHFDPYSNFQGMTFFSGEIVIFASGAGGPLSVWDTIDQQDLEKFKNDWYRFKFSGGINCANVGNDCTTPWDFYSAWMDIETTEGFDPWSSVIGGAGDNTEIAFYLYECQHELGVGVSSLIRNTTTSPVTRAADVLTISPTPATYDITIERVDGIEIILSVVVGGGGYVVPNSLSPLRQVKFT